MLAASAADKDAEFLLQRSKSPLQRPDHAGGYARRMPIHSHHGAKRLEPERMRQPPQEFIAAIVVDDCLADHGAERRHPRRKPWRHMSAMQRKISAAGALAHGVRMIRSASLY